MAIKSVPYLGAAFALLTLASVRCEQNRPELGPCARGSQDELRQECDIRMSKQIRAGSSISLLDDGWQLVKTKSPSAGPDAVSVMHVADTKKSDINLAGLSLQCSQKGFEVVLVTLERTSRTDRAQVTLQPGAGRAVEFEATPVQSGEALLLPTNAFGLAAGEWQSATELTVEIRGKSVTVRGVIPIKGLAGAVRVLTNNCPAR